MVVQSIAKLIHCNSRKATIFGRDGCGLAFYDEKRFAFNQERYSQPENFIAAEARASGEHLRPVDPHSLQLFFSALYENFIYRPLRSLGNFLIVTKTIFYNPSATIDEAKLIS